VHVISAHGKYRGRVVYQCTWQDITDRKNARQRLRTASKKSRIATASCKRPWKEPSKHSRMSELKDPYTAGHQKRVAHIACGIARTLGLAGDTVEGLRIASLLHDVGKIQVPSELADQARAAVRPGVPDDKDPRRERSPDSGYGGFSLAGGRKSSPSTREGGRLGLSPGRGGNQIMIEARILAVADAVEAMASHRPYRPALGLDRALEEIESHSGSLFDP